MKRGIWMRMRAITLATVMIAGFSSTAMAVDPGVGVGKPGVGVTPGVGVGAPGVGVRTRASINPVLPATSARQASVRQGSAWSTRA